MNGQIAAMRESDVFRFGIAPAEGNISFGVLDGATHDYTYYRNYIYSALMAIWPATK